MLDYIALGILFFAFITLFYGVIVIHDIPYEISVHRNHPHQDAIHYAGWISLFTLHVLWPFLWIWATLYREDRGWGMESNQSKGSDSESGAGNEVLQTQLSKITQRLDALEQNKQVAAANAEATNTQSEG
jgi:hypothetical protein